MWASRCAGEGSQALTGALAGPSIGDPGPLWRPPYANQGGTRYIDYA